MRILLGFYGLWGFVTYAYTKFSNEKKMMVLTNVELILLRENSKKDNKIIGLTQQVLDDLILSKVSNGESSRKAWDTIE